MTDIQRFKITYLTFDRADVIREHETGDYVLYTDHIAAIEAVKATACTCTKFEQDEDCPVGYPSLLCELCDGKGVLPSILEAKTTVTYSEEEFDEAYEIGKRDGYSDAAQEIDQKTGGDGEYRYCLGMEDDVRHTPDPATMIQRIVDRFDVLNLLEEATKTGSDQPDDGSTLFSSPALEEVKPVAWRWRDNEHQTWNFIDSDPVHMDYVFVEPLYSVALKINHQTPVTDAMVESGYGEYCRRINLFRTNERDHRGVAAFRAGLEAALSEVKS